VDEGFCAACIDRVSDPVLITGFGVAGTFSAGWMLFRARLGPLLGISTALKVVHAPALVRLLVSAALVFGLLVVGPYRTALMVAAYYGLRHDHSIELAQQQSAANAPIVEGQGALGLQPEGPRLAGDQ